MKKTGELLKATREQKGLSLHEIGLSLKISSKILKSIEENDQAHLPAKTFLRGFVQSYAQYLKLNTDEVMALFTEEMGSTRPKPILKNVDSEGSLLESLTDKDKSAPPADAPKISSPQELQIKPIIYSIIVIFLLVLIFMVKKVVDRYQKEAVVETVQVSNPLPTQAPAETTTTTPNSTSAATTANQSTSVSESTTPVEEKPKVEASAIAPAISLIKPKELPKPPQDTKPVETKPTEKTTETTAAVKEAPAKPSAEPEKPKTKPVELIVEAMDNVEIEYASQSGKTGKIKLNADQVHTFKSSNGLTITIDNGGAVNLILNGKDLGVPGELGKPVRRTY